MHTYVFWNAYHAQDGRSALSRVEEIQVGRSQYPYQIHLVQNYDQLPIRDEVRHGLPPNDRGHHHHHHVHLVPDCGVHVVPCYVQHALLGPCGQSNLLLPSIPVTYFFMAGPGGKG